jgi:hypothetical protein
MKVGRMNTTDIKKERRRKRNGRTKGRIFYNVDEKLGG